MVSYVLFIVNRASVAAVTVDAIVAFAGSITLIVAVTNMISSSLPKDKISVGQGLNSSLRQLGSAVGPVVTTSIIASYSVQLIETINGKAIVVASLGSATAFNVIFIVGIVLSAVTMVLGVATSNYSFNKGEPPVRNKQSLTSKHCIDYLLLSLNFNT